MKTMTVYSPPAMAGRDVLAPRAWHARLMDWAVEARSHRVILLVMGIWMLNGFDLAFTVIAYQQGMLHEENPLARHMLRNGMPSIVLFKIGLVLIGSYPLLRFRTARITELGSMVILVAYAMLAMHWSECLDLYATTVGHGVNIKDLAQLNGFVP